MIIPATLLLFGVAAGLVNDPDPDLPSPPEGADFTISRLPLPDDLQPLSELGVTDHVINLKRRSDSVALSAFYVQAMRKSKLSELAGPSRAAGGVAPLIAVENGNVFLAPITIGGQDFEVVVDTGSSDPWVVQPNFTCADPRSNTILEQQDCYFGATYDSSQSTTYSRVPDQNFNITYSDGERLTGDMGFERMTMAGITVPRQKFATVDYAAWYGDGYSAGLVGFAYGTLTNAYPGDDPSQDRRGNTIMYNPLFVSMYNQSLIPPVFSMAIDRDLNVGGVLALGGIPNIPHSPYYSSSPIRRLGFFPGTNTPAYEFYEVRSDGFAISSTPNAQWNLYPTSNPRKKDLINNGTAVVIDSGTTLIYAPNNVADAVAAAFDPPGEFTNNAYFVSCDAQSPVFGVSIGRKIFFVNAQDMKLQVAPDICVSGVQPNNGGLTILGDVWMKNVLAVFDVGAAQMSFAARQQYGLFSSSKPATT